MAFAGTGNAIRHRHREEDVNNCPVMPVMSSVNHTSNFTANRLNQRDLDQRGYARMYQRMHTATLDVASSPVLCPGRYVRRNTSSEIRRLSPRLGNTSSRSSVKQRGRQPQQAIPLLAPRHHQ
jgi:hypothetical protein